MQGFGALSVLRTISFALLLQVSNGVRKRNMTSQSRGDAEGSSLQQAYQHQEAVNAAGLSRRRGKRGRRRCKFELTRPSAEEESMLEKMMTVMRPHEVGKGRDANVRDPHRKSYSKIQFRSAWKVSNTPALDTYRAKVEKLEAEKNGTEIPLTTDAGGFKVGNNEYLFWHGGEPEYLDWKVCKGAVTGEGVFGDGIYLADAVDKMDQYAMTDEKGMYFQDLLDELHLEDDKMPSGWFGEKKDIVFGLILRTYMGHHAEVQRDGYGHGNWYWRDPLTGDCQTGGSEPPFSYDGPRKAVATSKDKSFCGRKNGRKPVWFNEYLVPTTDLAAVEYIVVYDRKK